MIASGLRLEAARPALGRRAVGGDPVAPLGLQAHEPAAGLLGVGTSFRHFPSTSSPIRVPPDFALI